MSIFLLSVLIGLFFCHFLADFTWLSTKWMLDAKYLGKPFTPIAAHALIHAILMSLFIWLYLSAQINHFAGITSMELQLFALQFSSHFIIDIWKGRMNEWFPILRNPANKLHWVVFGFDQFLHAVVIILMAYSLTK